MRFFFALVALLATRGGNAQLDGILDEVKGRLSAEANADKFAAPEEVFKDLAELALPDTDDAETAYDKLQKRTMLASDGREFWPRDVVEWARDTALEQWRAQEAQKAEEEKAALEKAALARGARGSAAAKRMEEETQVLFVKLLEQVQDRLNASPDVADFAEAKAVGFKDLEEVALRNITESKVAYSALQKRTMLASPDGQTWWPNNVIRWARDAALEELNAYEARLEKRSRAPSPARGAALTRASGRRRHALLPCSMRCLPTTTPTFGGSLATISTTSVGGSRSRCTGSCGHRRSGRSPSWSLATTVTNTFLLNSPERVARALCLVPSLGPC